MPVFMNNIVIIRSSSYCQMLSTINSFHFNCFQCYDHHCFHHQCIHGRSWVFVAVKCDHNKRSASSMALNTAQCVFTQKYKYTNTQIIVVYHPNIIQICILSVYSKTCFLWQFVEDNLQGQSQLKCTLYSDKGGQCKVLGKLDGWTLDGGVRWGPVRL